jgi:hypothetical protein
MGGISEQEACELRVFGHYYLALNCAMAAEVLLLCQLGFQFPLVASFVVGSYASGLSFPHKALGRNHRGTPTQGESTGRNSPKEGGAS